MQGRGEMDVNGGRSNRRDGLCIHFLVAAIGPLVPLWASLAFAPINHVVIQSNLLRPVSCV